MRTQVALGALVVAPDRDEREVRGHEAVQAAPRLVRGAPDLGQALAVAVGLDDVGDPAVALASGARQRRVGAAPDQIGGPGCCTGLGSMLTPSNSVKRPLNEAGA